MHFRPGKAVGEGTTYMGGIVRLTGLVWACTSLWGAQAATATPLRVVATLPSLASIAQEVGGPDVQVTALSSAAEDPHHVDGKPSFVVALNRAQLLVSTGLDLEVGWLPTLIVAARNGAIGPGGGGYFEAARFVDLLEVPKGRLDRAMGDVHPGGNPHFLTDPRRVAQVARGLGARLGAVDPAHACDYTARAAQFAARLSALADKQAARFATKAAAQRQVVTYHRSWAYLLAWLDLHEVATIEPRPGVAPDPGHVAHVLAVMRQQHVRAVLQERYFPSRASRTLCELAHANFVILPGGVDLGGGQDYLTFFDRMCDLIFAAL